MRHRSPRRVLPVATAFFGFIAAATARGDAPADDAELRGYYGGERTSAYVVAGIGVAGAAAGAVLVSRSTGFERGLGWPLLTMGGLETVGGIFYALQVNDEIDHYRALLARDPAGYKSEESAHIEGTTKRFLFYRLAELGLTLAGTGLAVYGFAADEDAFKGVGIGVGGMALPFLVIDTINDGRAKQYREWLRAYRPGLTLSPTARGRGVVVSFGASL